MTVVITGTESFIGEELRRHCREAGVEYVGLDSVASDDPACVVMDIRSPEVERIIPQGAEALVHLAAISRDQDCRADPSLAFDVNVMGTLALIRAAQRRGVRQFVFASSEWVYGDVSGMPAQIESQPIDVTKVLSEYALTKLVGEQCLRQACASAPMDVVILRFGIVYGPRPGNWSAVEALFHAVRTSDTVTVGSRGTARRFIHVADVADGILASIGLEGFEVLNLSGDVLVTLGEVIDASAEVLGRKPTVIEKDPAGTSIRNPDNAYARKILDWRPRIGLGEGLETLMSV